MIYLVAQTAMCAPQLSAMLACWAASGDLHNRALCKETAEQLFQCMRTTVRSFMSFCSFFAGVDIISSIYSCPSNVNHTH